MGRKEEEQLAATLAKAMANAFAFSKPAAHSGVPGLTPSPQNAATRT